MQWRPVTSLDDGLLKAIAFVSENPGLYAPETYIV